MSRKVIFLIGFMGAGKSRTGKRLAKALDLPFIDSDIEITKLAQKSVEQIFREEGETYFRELEQNWLNNLTDSPAVIAVGGGLPCFYDNMERMKTFGLTIYLQLSVKALAGRLQQSKSIRPLIEPFKQDDEALKSFILSKLEEREVYYKQAQLQLNGLSLSSDRMNALIQTIEGAF